MKLIENLLELLLNRYQNNLERWLIKVSDFFFDYIHLLNYKCHKINPNRGGSYIDSPDWIINVFNCCKCSNKSWTNQKISARNNKN